MESRRYPRTAVRMAARIHHDRGWDDASILDVSKMGVRFSTRQTLQRGSYVELRRGSHVIVAQVMWSDGGKAGARTQDVVCLNNLLSQNANKVAVTPGVDRRKICRPTAQSHRAVGQTIERAGVWVGIAAFCSIAAVLAYETLSQPFSQVEEVIAAAHVAG